MLGLVLGLGLELGLGLGSQSEDAVAAPTSRLAPVGARTRTVSGGGRATAPSC